jgi:hypothetical protein
MRLNFAKTDSDLIAKLNGNFDDNILKKRLVRHEADLKAREIK